MPIVSVACRSLCRRGLFLRRRASIQIIVICSRWSLAFTTGWQLFAGWSFQVVNRKCKSVIVGRWRYLQPARSSCTGISVILVIAGRYLYWPVASSSRTVVRRGQIAVNRCILWSLWLFFFVGVSLNVVATLRPPSPCCTRLPRWDSARKKEAP